MRAADDYPEREMTATPPSTRRRKVLWTMAILGAALLAAALAAADWRLVRAEYHAFRLNRAQTRAEAEPHLEALLDLAGHEPAAESLVARLGIERPLLTFWVFEWLRAKGEASTEPGQIDNREIVRFLPCLRGLVDRCERDPQALRAWAHFLRWRKLGFLGTEDTTNLQTFGPRRQLEEAAREDPPLFEVWVRLVHLRVLEWRWTSGAPAMQELTEWADPDLPAGRRLAYAETLEAAEKALARWWSDAILLVEFDSASGRFVKRQDGTSVPSATVRTMPQPRFPLPGWEGPVPETWPSQLEQDG